MTLSCLTLVALSPFYAEAQAPAVAPLAPAPPPNSQVSVRELEIPAMAHEAFNSGTSLLLQNQPASSIPEFQRALKIFPDFYEAHYKLGLANLNLRRYPEAQAAFESSIEVSKGRYPPANFGLGVALCTQRQYSEAEEAVRGGLDQVPADAAGNFTLAWILFNAGRFSEADKAARQAVVSNSNLASAYLLLAQIHLRQDDLTAVVSELDAYLRLDPEGPHKMEAQALRTEAQQWLAKRPSTGPVVAETPVKNNDR
jgi:tetratricopeptide (TPR) repeat protein